MAYSPKKQEKLRESTEEVEQMFRTAADLMVGIYLPVNSPYEMVVIHNLRGDRAMWSPSTGVLRVPTGNRGKNENIITKSDDFAVVVNEFLKKFPH